MPSFENFPLWGNLLAIAVAAIVVWRAGVRLEGSVEVISRCTGLGSAFGGLVLLAVATSLPELATTISGAIIGNAALLTNNLLGGVAMQTVVLVIADIVLVRGALTYFAPSFSLLLGGVSLMMLLGVALAVMSAGDTFAVWNVGIGTTAIFVVHLTLLYLTYRSGGKARWQPTPDKSALAAEATPEKSPEEQQKASLRREWLFFAGCAGLILVAGWVVMHSAEALTKQTGMAASFVGATLVAIATSLPEISTTTAAVRRGDNEMAVSNIFGSNLWDTSLLFIGDLFFRSGPLLHTAPRQAMFTASLGLVLTAIYIWGMLERQNKTVGRLGIDSMLVIGIYIAGLAVLYSMG